MADPIIPYIEANDVAKSTASLLNIISREIKKSGANVGEDGLTLIFVQNGDIKPSTRSVGSSLKHIFLQDGKFQVSSANVGGDKQLVKMVNGELVVSTVSEGTALKFIYLDNGVLKETTTTLGSGVKHVYLQDGVFVASTANVGTSKKFAYMENGELKETSESLGSGVKHVYTEGGVLKESTASVGGTDKFVHLKNGELTETDVTRGSSVKPVYFENGQVKESGANVGGADKVMFMEGGELKESTANLGNNTKHVYLQGGQLKESTANVGGLHETYEVTSDVNPVDGKHYYRLESGTYTDITSTLDPTDDLSALGYDVYERTSAEFQLIFMNGGSIEGSNDANIGGNSCFLYLENGVLKASTLTAGQSAKLLEIVNGSVKESTANVGGAGKIIKVVNGQIVEDTETIGGNTKLVYLSNGQLVESDVDVGSDEQPVKLVGGQVTQVAAPLAKKVAPTLERQGESRTTTEADREVPTSPTPRVSDPASMIATKEYVDNAQSANATYGYGVVNGDVCVDDEGNECVTSFKSTIDADKTIKSIEYVVKNDCYLYIELDGDVDIKTGTNDTAAIDIKVRDRSVGRLIDHNDDGTHTGGIDSTSWGLHVAAGTTITLSHIDGESSMFYNWDETTADLVFTEYRLSPISPLVEMPKYDLDHAEDIHVRAFSSDGYLANRRGYLLASIFDERGVYIPSSKSMKIYVNGILVMNGRNIIKQMLVDSVLDRPDLIGTNAGSVKKVLVTTGSTLTLDNPSNFKAYTCVAVNGKYEYRAISNPGTVSDNVLTFDSSLDGETVVVVDGSRHIEDIKLTDTGACLIPINKYDVVTIRAEENGTDSYGSAKDWPSNYSFVVSSATTYDPTEAYFVETLTGMHKIATEAEFNDCIDTATPIYIGTATNVTGDVSDTLEHRWQALFLQTRQVSASGSSDGEAAGVGGGVIDGVLCTDEDGVDCVTDYTKANGKISTSTTKIEYTVQNDCYLSIVYSGFDIEGSSGSNSGLDYLNVCVGNNVVARIVDNMNSSEGNRDSGSVGFPVKRDSKITIVGSKNGPMFDMVSDDALLRISEYRLNSLSTTVGIPDYSKPEIISEKVIRTSVDASRGYVAPADGYVLFQFNPIVGTDYTKQHKYVSSIGYVGGVMLHSSELANDKGSTYSQAQVATYDRDCSLVPVRKGDTIDWRLVWNDGVGTTTSVIPYTTIATWADTKCIFFPLRGSAETSMGPIEIPIVESQFTDTSSNNPFYSASASIPPARKLNITASRIKELSGRDVDLESCSISLKVDVIYPQYTVDGYIKYDGEGFIIPDDSKPKFSDEPMAYGSNNHYIPFGVYKTKDMAKVSFSIPLAAHVLLLRSLMTISGATTEGLPIVDDTRTTWNYAHGGNNYPYFITNAAALGLTKYYIRLTAVIDQNRVNVKTSKSGVYTDGTVAVDENGNACKTLVPFSKWAEGWDATTNKCTYEYVVKTDCLLYINCQVELDHVYGYEEVSILINGEVIDTYAEAGGNQGALVTPYQTLTLPVKKGTKISFVANKQPIENQSSQLNPGIIDEEQFSIKIIEFKMDTELEPAKFPSLAIKVCDVDCHEEAAAAAADKVFPVSAVGRYFTWTESELRQIFGSAFDFDHAVFDTSAVFYIGDSDTDYDTASNKIEDMGVHIVLDSQGIMLRPMVTVDLVDGEKVAKVAFPSIENFVTTVMADASSGTLVLKAREAGYRMGIGAGGGNLVADYSATYGKRIRMRLLLHVADRRGMKLDKLPNGISPQSKMVRQQDLNLIPTESGASYTYSNEITVTEGGWCIIHANYDADSGTALDGGTAFGVAIEAFINNVWTVIAYQHSGEGFLTTGDGIGAWSFKFNVEAGTKLRAKTNFIHDGNRLTSIGTNTFIPYTRRQQAICWVIPIARYQNPEQNLPGSAGVIDGSIWKDEFGNDMVTSVPVNPSSYEYTYNVKNDCYLFVHIDTAIDVGTEHGYDYARILVNGVEAGRLNDMDHGTIDGHGAYENPACGINVARGSVVKLVGADNTHAPFSNNGNVIFTEFKLRATNVWAAMPDWDDSKKIILTGTESAPATSTAASKVAPADGWIAVHPDQSTSTSNYVVKVNGVMAARGYTYTALNPNQRDVNSTVIPVARGDVISWDNGSGGNPALITIIFYPIKMTEHVYPNKMIVPNWSGEGTTLASGTAVPADGFVVINGGGIPSLNVNGIRVSRGGNGVNNIDHSDIIPVAKGDIVTFDIGNTFDGSAGTVRFYPAKPESSLSSYMAEITLVDAPVTDGIFDMVADLMSNDGVVPSNDSYNAGKFALPTTLTDAKYATLVQFMKGVTEAELNTMTGNSNVNLVGDGSIEFKLVTYRGASADAYASAEKYEEMNPMVLVGGGTGPRAFIGTLRAIISRNNGVTSIRVPWPGSFVTNSASHWSTPPSGSTPKFYPADFCTVQQLGEDSTNKYYGGSDLRARVVMILKRG